MFTRTNDGTQSDVAEPGLERGIPSSVVCAPGTDQYVNRLAAIAGVLGCCLLIALGAQVRVPVPGSDVPMTLQPLAVLLTAFILPRSRAVGATLLYLACGTAGLPVFAAGSGGLAGPTGGYLAGFVVCAWLVGTVCGGRETGFARLLGAGAVGIGVIFAVGALWRVVMALTFGGDPLPAVVTGVAPFVVKGVVELLLAVAAARSVRTRLSFCR